MYVFNEFAIDMSYIFLTNWNFMIINNNKKSPGNEVKRV